MKSSRPGFFFYGRVFIVDAFIHATAVVDEGVDIGAGTKIWHFSHVLKDSVVGQGCNIGQNAVIGPDVRVGNNCKIQNNVSVYKGVTIGQYAFVGAGAVPVFVDIASDVYRFFATDLRGLNTDLKQRGHILNREGINGVFKRNLFRLFQKLSLTFVWLPCDKQRLPVPILTRLPVLPRFDWQVLSVSIPFQGAPV